MSGSFRALVASLVLATPALADAITPEPMPFFFGCLILGALAVLSALTLLVINMEGEHHRRGIW